MTVFGISMVRDEADVVGQTVTKMLAQVDEVIVADNGSVDGTREILDALPIIVVDDRERGYYQSQKMSMLAQLAGDKGADWVVPFDADERWYSPFSGRIADLLDGIAPQWLTASAQLFDHVATAADDSSESDPLKRIGWRRRKALPLPKVACRVRPDLVIDQGNHGATYDGGTTCFADQLVVRHFPYRSREQFIRKARNGAEAYRATDLPATFGAHWREWGDLLDAQGEDALGGVFEQWYFSAHPRADRSLIFDPCPV